MIAPSLDDADNDAPAFDPPDPDRAYRDYLDVLAPRRRTGATRARESLNQRMEGYDRGKPISAADHALRAAIRGGFRLWRKSHLIAWDFS